MVYIHTHTHTRARARSYSHAHHRHVDMSTSEKLAIDHACIVLSAGFPAQFSSEGGSATVLVVEQILADTPRGIGASFAVAAVGITHGCCT